MKGKEHLDGLDHCGIVVAVLPHYVTCGNPVGAQPVQYGSRKTCNSYTCPLYTVNAYNCIRLSMARYSKFVCACILSLRCVLL